MQEKHLKDILKIKAEAVKNNIADSKSKEVESNLREVIDQLREELESAKSTIKRLKEELSEKEKQFKESIINFKKRETLVMQQRDKFMRRPQEMSESSESESSEEEKQAPQTKKNGKNLIDILKTGNKKVCRNDLLNLPSSEDENIVVSMKSLFQQK